VPDVPTTTPLAPGSSITCSASYTAPRDGAVTPTVTAGSSTSDPNSANNASPVTTSVNAVAAVPVPMNAWWSLAALALAILGAAAAVGIRRTR
jgi:hypothetical protein